MTTVLIIDTATQEAQTFLDTCYKIQDQFKTESREIHLMTKLISYSKRFFREFNARGYFKINKGVIFSLVGNVATYFIIAMQFNEQQYRQLS